MSNENSTMNFEYHTPTKVGELKDRWVSLIRNHGATMVQKMNKKEIMSPDLFEIANEMDAFFVGLEAFSNE